MYRNTLDCIAVGMVAGGKVVSQYNLEYCGRRQGCLCRKTGSCVATRRWAGELGARLGTRGSGAGRMRALGARRRWASGRAVGEAPARGARGAGAVLAAWLCCWAMGCTLGALGLFLARFDSVLFLSQFLDIVLETGS